MIRRSSFGTIVTALSGVAGLVCLLTGLQLWYLGEEFGQILGQDPAAAAGLLEQWRIQARMAAFMSAGAGLLVFLLVIRQASSRVRSTPAFHPDGDASPAASMAHESLTVRVFEVDPQDQAVEIWGETVGTAEKVSLPRLRTPQTDLPSPGEQSESIIRNIEEIAGTEPAGGPQRTRGLATFLKKLLGRI